MKRPLLLTGFKPFAGHPANPSELVVRRLGGKSVNGVRVRCAVLPVVYKGIEEEVNQLLNRVNPAAVVSLGLDYKTDVIKLERIAINIDDSAVPDESGEVRQGSIISSRGPAARWSGLPLDAIAAALSAAEIPFRFSTHAGAYLCNHLMYHLCGRAAAKGIPAGFVHLPPTPDLVKPEELLTRTGEALEQQVEAVREVVRAVTIAIGHK